jgi:hypothetical protein
MRVPCRRGRPALLLAALMAAACQPLPHPFAEDRPPASLLTVRDSAGVSIAPIEGGPSATAGKLGAAVASALGKRDIPASDRTTSLGSYLLYGRLEAQRPRAGNGTLTVHWRLQESGGRSVGERTARLEVPARAWDAGDDTIIASLAEASAAEIAPLLPDEAAPAAVEAAAGGRTRIAIRPVSGAPGDGAKSLANAIATVLKRQDLAVLDDPSAKADVILDGEVTIAPVKPDKQHVKIVWHVRRGDGAEIGTVGQENDVPKGLLDGAWGDVAYSVAIAGVDGLLQVIARAAPDGKS